MPQAKKTIVSIALLLKHPRALDLAVIERAAQAAYRNAPAPVRAIAMERAPGYGILLGPMRIGVLNVAKPYFPDPQAAAQNITNFAARRAVLQHTAWLSADLVGDAPGVEPQQTYAILGRLIAELLDPDVLGLIRLPTGPIIGYDFSFIPLLRSGRADRVFEQGPPDRTVKIQQNNPDLQAATAQAKQRWPEFLAAFAARDPQQGFAVKKAFTDGDKVEHMWVSITRIEGDTLHGWVSNTPNVVSKPQLREKVTLDASEVEDWIYSKGKEHIGEFQAKVFESRRE